MQKLRILNDISWQPLIEGAHPPSVEGPPGVAVYREVDEAAGPMAGPTGGSGGLTPKSPAGATREVGEGG